MRGFSHRRQLRPNLRGEIGTEKPSSSLAFGGGLAADVFPSLPSVGGVLGGWTPGDLTPSGSSGGVAGGWVWARDTEGKSMKDVLQVNSLYSGERFSFGDYTLGDISLY